MPAAAATAADTSTRLKRSANRSLSARSLRLRNIAAATTAAMCSPLTDSRCVSPLRRIASASVLADGILVAGDKGDGDPRLAALQPAMDMPRQPLPDRIEPAARAGLDQLDRPQRLADRADAPEPRVAGEVIGPRHRHRRRRHQPRAHPNDRAAHQPLRRLVLIDRYPQPRRQRRVAWRQGQADRALGDHRLDPFDPGLERRDDWPIEPRRGDPFGPRPDQARNPPPRHSANQPSARPLRSRLSAKPPRPRPAARQMNAAQSSGRPSANQAAIPVPKPTTSHGGSCARSASSSASSRSPSVDVHAPQ